MKLRKLLESCHLCPRKCGVNRINGQTGACNETLSISAARAALHMWEEPCISGENGSGAVFFSGCSLGCAYCQNHDISGGLNGKEITIKRLSEIFFELKEQGANNINLVTPDHFIPQIIEAIDMAKKQGFDLPFVYNCSGYEEIEALKLLDGYIDIYLPDFKYMSADLAARYSHAPDYPVVAKAAIAEMVRQCGEVVLDAEDAYIRRGVIVRHMLLPKHLLEAEKIIRYLYETYGNRIYISMMSQYTPVGDIGVRFPELADKVRRKSYRKLLDYAVNLGVEQAFYQEGEVAKESFIPEFYKE